jgi:hypothetical protein
MMMMIMIMMNKRSYTTCKWNASKKITQGNETLLLNWQEESWQTSEETSGYVRPERVNRRPNSMTDI